ncbi:phosphate ABC transporter permease subunit PstC [Rubinisphaera brasiliensis]|uniref:Phosphate transport system permease protein n=1 Tax=Rubinisphaera brasiliensis (strain ATCC 49424 / DSM 5305 / JCM 21570 / IAM 15109 / NBRC 103401 / IFAM 1448) TaxID=756272 RepID=F0SNU8_RUBBR|nr:phosphate ABC transporter permease subunit PstC [Rubinisphaera brasiliensis]ADY60024.1 phosphate ABC transporter membrane protein 1, PhoT family [Rubinisphaera brasiliensis DSM 5305]
MNNSRHSLSAKTNFRRVWETIVFSALWFCAVVSILTTGAIIFVLVTESIIGFGDNLAFFQKVSVWNFLTDLEWSPQYGEGKFGILPLFVGTLWVTGIAALIGLPIGLASAIYLSEYATPTTRSIVKPVLEILAGIPTVVYGYFALIFITPLLIKPFGAMLGIDVNTFNALSGGIVVGIMIIPMVTSLSEDVLRAVPRGLREAGYALGSTRLDVSVKIVLPAALSGILASFLLAISRALGETMAVTIAVGIQPQITMNPFQTMCTMTANIVSMASGDSSTGSIEYRSIYAVALSLFLITLALNILSQFILNRYREVYN